MLAKINEIKNNLSRYVERALKGEEVILSRYNVPVARIVPLEKKIKKNRTILGRSAKEGHLLGEVVGPFLPDSDWKMHLDQK